MFSRGLVQRCFRYGCFGAGFCCFRGIVGYRRGGRNARGRTDGQDTEDCQNAEQAACEYRVAAMAAPVTGVCGTVWNRNCDISCVHASILPPFVE